MARAHFVKSARKAIPHAKIKVGDSYYWWKFRYGGRFVSKTPPKPSQLTQSEYLQAVYGAEEEFTDLVEGFRRNKKDFDLLALADAIDSIAQTFHDQSEECQCKLDSMPQQLQDTNSGELLQNRIAAADDTASGLECLAEDIRTVWEDEEMLDKRGEAIALLDGFTFDFGE